jgi:protein-L-isoaspartate(D-aspartate) O-methyltransferase
MEDETYYDHLRNRMINEQIASRGIHEERLLEALQRVPRHWFVPQEYADIAYSDGPLPIGHGQTISQPYIVALMTELLELQGDELVLEVGTGSGYQAALLGAMSRQVHTIERHPALAEKAQQVLRKLGMTNVMVHIGDGTLGLPEYSPFQAIMVTDPASPNHSMTSWTKAAGWFCPRVAPVVKCSTGGASRVVNFIRSISPPWLSSPCVASMAGRKKTGGSSRLFVYRLANYRSGKYLLRSPSLNTTKS